MINLKIECNTCYSLLKAIVYSSDRNDITVSVETCEKCIENKSFEHLKTIAEMMLKNKEITSMDEWAMMGGN